MDEVSKVLLALYAACREYSVDEFHEAALRLLKRELPFDSAVWGTGVITTHGLTYHSVHLHNERDDLPQLYRDVQHQDDVAFRAWREGDATQRFYAPTLYRGRSRTGIREYAARVGHQNGLSDWERAPENNIVHWIGLYRKASENQYSDRDLRYMKCVAPHLREALRINRILHMERLNRGSQPYHSAIVDIEGLLYHAESAFLELVRAEWPHWSSATLPRPLIERLAKSQLYVGGEVVIRCSLAASLLFLSGRRKRVVDGLTERERVIAQHVAQGCSHKAIARALGISPATVRNHVQNIHRKLDVHNNAELAAHIVVD